MAGEPDQTKWVGVRPTDPSEAIPVTTKKPAPAIGDLQAIKENLAWSYTLYGQNCTVSYGMNSPSPDVGEMWVITNLAIHNDTSMCDLVIKSSINAFLRGVTAGYSYEPGIWMSWQGLLVLENPDHIAFQYFLGGAADNIVALMHGYKIGAY